jgi:hypothetical protein
MAHALPGARPRVGLQRVRSQVQTMRTLPSLDRWDNSKGYVPGNVFVISWAR